MLNLKKKKKTKRAWAVLGETEKSLWSDERNINLYQNAGKRKVWGKMCGQSPSV